MFTESLFKKSGNGKRGLPRLKFCPPPKKRKAGKKDK